MTEGPHIDERGVDIGMDPMTSCAQTNRLLRSDHQSEQLLPGIPDGITLDQISTKLPWRDCQILSSVSRCWKRAIESHQVYDARARSHSTETLVVFNRDSENSVVLYSMKDKSCYDLPQLPNTKINPCISLDGKIYALGAVPNPSRETESAEVHVFDLAGQRKWQRCASMLDSRNDFGCGVLDGKIYVFGGQCRHKCLRGASEVYDPKVDAWFPIKPMASSRINHQVAAIGEELFVYGGCYLDRHFFGQRYDAVEDDALFDPVHQHSLFLEAYHPIKNEWIRVRPFASTSPPRTIPSPIPPHRIFVAGGKFHVMTELGIDIHDFENNL